MNEVVTTDCGEDRALALDAEADPASRRSEFLIPPAVGGEFPLTAYLAGNSLGLQPRATRAELMADLDAWEEYGVRGHTEADRPWFPYHEELRDPAARLVGALPREVVIMNSLTVNLHLLLASFYRPTAIRHRIVIEDRCFSSDSYAVRSHVALRGHDPDTAVLRLRPRPGEAVLRTEAVLGVLHDHAHSIATVMIGGSRDGGAPIRRAGSRCARSRSRSARPMRGRCPTRRSWRWARCARRSTSSTRSGCRPCASAASA